MQCPNLSKWSNEPELEGLLFFAQTLEEMLFHHTVDSFKARALNLHTNVIELQFLARQLLKGRIAAGTLVPVLEELEDRFKRDPVLSSEETSIFKAYAAALRSSRSKPNDLVAVSEALLAELESRYWPALVTQLEEAVKDPSKKKRILSLTEAFVTEAELRGFSRSFIYHTVKRTFFDANAAPQSIDSFDHLTRFLETFQQPYSRWRVVFRVSGAFDKLIDYAKYFSLEISDECPVQMPTSFRNRAFLGESTDYPLYVMANIDESRDPVSARDHGSTLVEALCAVYSFLAHEEELHVDPVALVMRGDDESPILLKAPPNPLRHGAKRNGTDGGSDLVEFIEIFTGKHFDRPSTYVFFKSIDYHRAALQAETPENQLLDLWASLEGFLPSPSTDTNRITYYVDAMLPSLTLTYPEKILRYVVDGMYWGGQSVREFVDDLDTGQDFFEKAVALIVCDELDSERGELYGMLDHHPLLRFRMFVTNQQFRSKERIRKTIGDHKTRVSWHIQRIYTTRNQIVHSAESLPYLRTLVGNLHSYVDILLETLSVVGTRSASNISIAGALKMLSIHEVNYMRNLEGENSRCSLTDFKGLVFGDNNPLSPFA